MQCADVQRRGRIWHYSRQLSTALLTGVCTMRVCAALSSMLLCLTRNEGEGIQTSGGQ